MPNFEKSVTFTLSEGNSDSVPAQDFARDLACYNSISSSIVSILNGIEHDQLRLLRRRDRAEVVHTFA